MSSENITAILTGYKRDYFDKQISQLKNQSTPISNFFIFQNEKYIDLSYLREKYGVHIVQSDINTKYWGRFAIAQIINSEYILIMDDDIIPGTEWVENCLRLCKEKNCIVCANGRNKHDIKWGVGDLGAVPSDTQVDYGGHSWFFKQQWLKYMWIETPITYTTGEDIHFCACAKIHGNISTWVPRQIGNTSATLQNYASDEHASWKINPTKWDEVRTNICNKFIEKGWK